MGVPNELQELRSEGNFLLPDRQLSLKDSTSHTTEKKCPRLGTKRCLNVPSVGQAGTFWGGFVPVEEKSPRLGAKRCSSVPTVA